MNTFMIEQAAMYSAYHRDHRNIATHVIGVPAIAFAIVMLLHAVPLGAIWPGLTLGWVAVAIAAIFYIWMQPVAGIILDVLLVVGAWIAYKLLGLPPLQFWIVFAAIFVGGAVIQLVGHGFEGRRPAFLDNLLQVFVAPLFLVLEGLFAAGLLLDVKAAIEARAPAYAADRIKTA